MLDDPVLESDAGEAELDRLTILLRSGWLMHANSVSSRYFKSPPSFQRPVTPSGAVALTPYDRWMEPVALEARARNYRRALPGWHVDHVMFNTGMSAMTGLFMVMRTMFQPRAAAPLHCHGLGGYFEIMDLMAANNDELFRTNIVHSQEALMESVSAGGSQLLYVEPVSCRFDLEVFDIESFLNAWQKRPARVPSVLIFDTTLTGNLFPVADLLKRMGSHQPLAVIQVSSMIKLDQEGMEFSNGGLMSIYSANRGVVEDLSFRMRRFRSAMGLSMGMDQVAALDYPGFLDSSVMARHSQSVFENNAAVARKVEVGEDRLFASCSHPSINAAGGARAWSVAPFFYLRLRPGSTKEDLQLLKFVVNSEVESRGMAFQPGSSFGFRGHRCELGGIRDVDGYETIRVAMGSRPGPALEGVISLLNELSRVGDFDTLRARYPGLIEIARKADEAKKKHARRG